MKKNIEKKGFTIIELLAVIVVLAIIALIAIPTILGVIDRARKGSAVSSAYGYIDAVEKQIALATLSSINYEDKEDYAYDEIEVSLKGKIPTAGTYELENSKVKNAVFCINGYTVTYSNNVASAGEKCNPDDLKYKGSVKLSSSFGSYTYPETGTVEVIENISGGNLSCSSSDEEVATCSIEGTIVTVASGTKEGTATLTIKSEGNSKYKEAQAAYVVTSKNGLLSVTAEDKTVTYDGKNYGITVTSSGATIKYKDGNGSYTLTSSPTYTDAGTYTIYYQVTKTGYKTLTSSKTLTINQAENPISVVGKTNLTYNGSAQALATVSNAEGNVCYSTSSKPTSCTSAGSIPTKTDAGSYTVYYYVAGNTNYKAKSGSVTATIAQKDDSISVTEKTVTYNGSGQTATFTATSGLTPSVTYYSNSTCTTKVSGNPTNAGTYYAKATTAGNTNYNAGSLGCTKAVTINKANNTLTLSANTGTVTYPTAGTFEITTNTSGGALSCASSNEAAATCSISGNIVTVTPGTTEADSVTITITSEETTNYNAAQVAYVVTSKNGLLSVTAEDKTVTYDGKDYGITVTSSGATIKYKDGNGSYTLTSSPTYTDAGTYTIYYQVTKTGYKTVTGSKNIVISKASGSVIAPTAKTLTYNGTAQALINSGSSTTGEIQYKIEGGSYSTNIPTAIALGTYTVYYKVVGDINHNDVVEKSVVSKILDRTLPQVNIINYGSIVDVCVWDNESGIHALYTGYTKGNYSDYDSITEWYAWGYYVFSTGEGSIKPFKSENKWCYRFEGVGTATIGVVAVDNYGNSVKKVFPH